jgi:predicted amidophosphoribosyltransferase
LDALAIGLALWYHTDMSTTHNNEETTRPEPRCPRCGSSEDAPNDRDLCENCVDALDAEYDAGPEMIIRLATRNANADEEREYCEEPWVDAYILGWGE